MKIENGQRLHPLKIALDAAREERTRTFGIWESQRTQESREARDHAGSQYWVALRAWNAAGCPEIDENDTPTDSIPPESVRERGLIVDAHESKVLAELEPGHKAILLRPSAQVFSQPSVAGVAVDVSPVGHRRWKARWQRANIPGGFEERHRTGIRCPVGDEGDILRIREAWANLAHQVSKNGVRGAFKNQWIYRVDGIAWYGGDDDLERVNAEDIRWCSPATMPASAARTRCRVLGVSVRRVEDVEENEIHRFGPSPSMRLGVNDVAQITGMPWSDIATLHIGLRYYWDNRWGKQYPWWMNPWAWVVTVERVNG